MNPAATAVLKSFVNLSVRAQLTIVPAANERSSSFALDVNKANIFYLVNSFTCKQIKEMQC